MMVIKTVFWFFIGLCFAAFVFYAFADIVRDIDDRQAEREWERMKHEHRH